MKKLLLSIITLTTFGFGANAQVNIPDANFKAYLVGNTAINTNADTEIQVSEASAFTGLINCSNLSISDLTGIEAFTAATQLRCNSNSLTSLDVSSNVALIEIYCNSNSITILDLTTNTALQYLQCNLNSLDSLDVSNNTALVRLHCDQNNLSKLNVASGNNTTLIDYKSANNPTLTCIQVDNVAYSTSNWTNKDAGASFSTDCNACVINIPDANFKAQLVGNTAINSNGDTEIQCNEASSFSGQIDCGGLSISDLTGIEKFTSLTVLWCDNNSLINLDVTNNLALIDLRCHNNSLSSIDVTLNSSLDNLSISYNSIPSIDLSQNILLTGFYCFFNLFSNLDLTQTSVTTLRCHDNSLLTSLNFANGLNSNMTDPSFRAHNNPNLTCIQVDNPTYSTTNWTTYVDAGASFSTNCATSINEINTSTMTISPNPTQNTIFINTENKIEQLSIYSITGSLIKVIDEITTSVNVSELNKGMYLLVAKTNNGVIKSKFIKE